MSKKPVRKVAQCIQTLLELDGQKYNLNHIMDFIKDRDLSNPYRLKDDVQLSLNQNITVYKKSERMQCIETFMVKNWEEISNNEIVKNALIESYCKGRFTKERRLEMKEELENKCQASFQN